MFYREVVRFKQFMKPSATAKGKKMTPLQVFKKHLVKNKILKKKFDDSRIEYERLKRGGKPRVRMEQEEVMRSERAQCALRPHALRYLLGAPQRGRARSGLPTIPARSLSGGLADHKGPRADVPRAL